MAKTTTTTTVTINGIAYADPKGLVSALVESGLLVAVEAPKAEAPKASKKPSKVAQPKVDHVDKNGLKWLVSASKFNRADYTAMSLKMFGKEKPGRANREAVYRALGYIQ